jgi:hypothetical protein
VTNSGGDFNSFQDIKALPVGGGERERGEEGEMGQPHMVMIYIPSDVP